MSKAQSWVTLLMGVFILFITHASMQSGELPLRWSNDKMTVTNPNFWLFAGSFVGCGLVMVLGGLIYLAVEHKYLPNINTKDGVQSVVYTVLILIASGTVGFVLKDLLPSIYL
jgi:hypothetical protein